MRSLKAATKIKVNASPTLLRFIKTIVAGPQPILDVPSGSGRNTFLAALFGAQVISVDIDGKALANISATSKRLKNIAHQIRTMKMDLIKEKWPFGKRSIGSIINVHFYRSGLLSKLSRSIIPGGYLYLETPGGYGENYLELPAKDFIRKNLERYFDFYCYKEIRAGPEGAGRVSVKLLARKKKNDFGN